MGNTQVTNSDNNVVQNQKDEIMMELHSKIAETEMETPLELVKKVVPLAARGIKITIDDESLNSLFLEIYVLSKTGLLPIVEKLIDFKTLTNELMRAGDILKEIIDYADKGFQLTDIPENEESSDREFSEEHLLFAEILMITDTEIRMHIPTPIEK